MKRLNLSSLANDLLWTYIRGEQTVGINIEIQRKEKEIQDLEEEIKELQQKVETQKAELVFLKESKQKQEARTATFEEQLEKSIKILLDTKSTDPELYEKRLQVHATELLKMPVEELRELVEKEGILHKKELKPC